MTTEYSIQKMVSDGTLSTIALGIQYLQRNDIYIRIAGEETPQSGAPSGYTWSFLDNTTLKILPVVPNGVEVVVHRRTDVGAMYNIYSQNAQFDEATIDENNQQLLYIAQEYLEQGLPGAGVDTIEFLRDDGTNTYYRIKRTDGSYSEEFAVPSASSSTKVLTREALRRSYADAGYNLVAGSFEAGGALVNANDVLLQERTGKAFSGAGPYPQEVVVGTNPVSGGFTDKSNASKRYYTTVAAMITGATNAPVGTTVEWGGYYAEGDCGGGRGIVKSGAHVADGGSIFSIDANTYVEAHIENTIFVKQWGAGFGSDDTSILQSIVSYADNNARVTAISLSGSIINLSGEVFSFDTQRKSLEVRNGVIRWNPLTIDSDLFYIDKNLSKIVVKDVDFVLTRSISDTSEPRGNIFHFTSTTGSGQSPTNNSFNNVNVTGLEAGGVLSPIANIFKITGDVQCDQSKVTSCNFEYYECIFNCENQEAVSWVFDRCGMFTIGMACEAFKFSTMSSSFTLRDCSAIMSGLPGGLHQTLLKLTAITPNDPPAKDAMFNIENLRLELRPAVSGQTTPIRIVDADFGRIVFNGLIANVGTEGPAEMLIKRYCSVDILNSNLPRGVYRVPFSPPELPRANHALRIANSTMVGCPVIYTENGVTLQTEYLNTVHATAKVVFDNVTDVISGENQTFTTWSDRSPGSSYEMMIHRPSSRTELPQFMQIDEIELINSKIIPANHPKIDVIIGLGATSTTIRLPIISVGTKVVLFNELYTLRYLYNTNVFNNEIGIEFKLVNTSDVAVNDPIDATFRVRLSEFSPKGAVVLNGINTAKVQNAYGAFYRR